MRLNAALMQPTGDSDSTCGAAKHNNKRPKTGAVITPTPRDQAQSVHSSDPPVAAYPHASNWGKQRSKDGFLRCLALQKACLWRQTNDCALTLAVVLTALQELPSLA